MRILVVVWLCLALVGGAWGQVSPRAKEGIKDALKTKEASDAKNTKPPPSSSKKDSKRKTTTSKPPAGTGSPAHKAASEGNVEALKAEDPASLAHADANGNTPLQLAAWKGQKEAVVYLLEQGLDVHAADARGTTALHLAAANGHAEIADLLLKAGADPNKVTTDTGQTALHRAAAGGYVAVVEVLVAGGAKLDTPDRSGNTAMALAERYRQGDWELVTSFLKKHENP
ncbi:MAG: ankyrin repeat domain-containing protein [Candidatus Eremiobacterota bacterium]